MGTEACRGGEKRETVSPQSDFGGRLSPPKISRQLIEKVYIRNLYL